MKTEGLKQALDKYGFDAAFGGARRDEENHAQKNEFIHSVTARIAGSENQRPELWHNYNGQINKGKVSVSSHYPIGLSWMLAIYLLRKHRHCPTSILRMNVL